MFSNKRVLLCAGVLAAVVLAASAFASRLAWVHVPQLLLADLFLILLLAVAVMAAALRNSLKKTLYSYGNIGLIGGLLFASVLEAVLIVCFAFANKADDVSPEVIFRTVVSFPRHFSYYAVFVIMAVSVLIGISNVALIRHEGFRPHNALSILLAGFYIGGTVLVYRVTELLTEKVFRNADAPFLALSTGISVFLLLMLCYFECILVGAVIMGWLAAHQKPAYDKDYIIILGCSIDKRGGLLPLLKGRVNRAVRFAWEQEIATGKPLKYVPSGGQGPNEVMSEGSAMELYLLTHGAEDYEVFPEKKSTSTWENMVFSKQIIDGLMPGAKIAFATTNYHMLRSGILAQQAGIDAEGIAGDTKWYFWPNGFLREFFAILTMNVRAHIWVAAVTAAICAVLGCIGHFGGLL